MSLDLEAIIAREKAASPGPSFATIDEPDEYAEKDREIWTISKEPDSVGWKTDMNYAGYGLKFDDANFYAHARADIPAMIKEIEELRNTVKLMIISKDMKMRTK